MSQVTAVVKTLEKRIGDIRVELTQLLSKKQRSPEEDKRINMLFDGYIAASNGQLGLSNADAKLSPGSASYAAVQLSESADNTRNTLSFKYTKLPPVPKEAAAEYSKAG